MIRVIVESPYAGDVERNVAYARAALRHSLMRGEAPIASHLLYTQDGVLDDNASRERLQGIAAGLHWLAVAELHVFYTDRGWSRGMLSALRMNLEASKPDFELRALDGRCPQLPAESILSGLDTSASRKLQRIFDNDREIQAANSRVSLPYLGLADGI